MGGMSRFTVSVPAALMEAVDKRLTRGKRGRSALVRRLLEDALRDEQEREDVARYIKGYQEQPQTEEEFGWLDVATLEYLKQEPWDEAR